MKPAPRESPLVPGRRWPGALLAAAWMLAAWAVWVWLGWRLVPGTWWFPIQLPDGAPIAPLRAMLGAAAVAVACAGWGAIALRALGRAVVDDARVRVLMTALLGSSLGSVVVFAVGIAGLLPWGLLLFFAGSGGLLLMKRTTHAARADIEADAATCPEAKWWVRAAWTVFITVMALTLVPALAPVVESDGLRYHVFAPQEYLKAGGIVHLAHHAFTNLPSQLQMLYLAGMWVGNDRTTQLIHGLHLPLLMLATGLVAERLATMMSRGRGAGARAFALAAALVGTMPVAMVIAGWPFVDLASATFVIAAFYIALPGAVRPIEVRGLVVGLLAGGAVAIKLSALLTVAPVGLVVAALASTRRRAVRTFVCFAVGAALLPAPWFARNIINHGNPVYPAAYGVFGGNEWSAEADALYKRKAGAKGFGKSPLDLILSPLDVTVRWSDGDRGPDDFPARDVAAVESIGWRLTTRRSPGFEDQNPGPALLALLPIAVSGLAAAALRRRHRAVPIATLGVIAFAWLAWFSSYQSVRFLIPVGALMVAAGAATLAARAQRDGPAITRALDAIVLLLAASGAAWFATYTLAVAPSRPAHTALGLLPAHDAIARRFNSFEAIEWLNAEVAPGERVFYIGEHRGLYARYPVELSDWFDVPRIATELRATPDNDAMLAAWRARGIRYVLVNMAELSMYLESDFRPRFTAEEWTRFTALLDTLSRREAIAFSPREGVFVVDLAVVVGS